MKTQRFRHSTVVSALAGIAIVGLALSGCSAATDASGSDGDGATTTEGVAFGATKAEYQAAFADVEPISLRVQGDGPDGSPTLAGRQAWTNAVEDWSDGKITFEWGYSNSFVPSAPDRATALTDGRLDVVNFMPYYTPEVFPVLSDLSNATFLDGNNPTATLTSTGWMTELLYEDVYKDEAAENGIYIMGLEPTANLTGIFCTEKRTSLDDLKGVGVSASGSGRVEQLTGLGMTPTSIAFTELYEALERGVVGCGSTVATAIASIGAVDLVPYMVADANASLVGFPSMVGFSKERWDSLPLVAQQLLFDRLDVYFATDAAGQSQVNAEWLKNAKAAGGGIYDLDKDASATLLKTNDGLLAELASRGIDTDAILAAHDKWDKIVNTELYPDVTTSMEEFLSNGAFDDIDLTLFMDALFAESLEANRPE